MPRPLPKAPQEVHDGRRKGTFRLVGRNGNRTLWLLLIAFAVFSLYERSSGIHELLNSLPTEITTSILPQKQQQQQQQQQQKRVPKLADGCLHVFLDAGANIGVHSRFLFEPQQYPKASRAHEVFEKAFGPNRDNRDVCAFAFEPNPAHWQRQDNLQEAYDKMGWRYTPFHAGVGDVENTTLAFYHNDPPANDPLDTTSEWGFSVIDIYDHGRREDVPIMHLARWIQREIEGRKMPATVHGNYQNPVVGKVVLKLDVEGMEFLVAPSLIFSGVMCRTIDLAFGEWHDAAHIVQRSAVDPATGQGELTRFVDWIAAGEYFNTLWKAMKSIHPNDCKSQWLEMPDIEDYLKDGVPFPMPPQPTPIRV